MAAVQQTWMRCELREPIRIATFGGSLFSADNHANLIGVVVTDGGQAAQLDGSVYASVIRSDGKTVVVTGGHIDGNRAWITLPGAAYAVPGLIFAAIRIAEGNTVTTIAAFTAVVTRAETGEAVDPGTLIPSIGDLISQIHEAVESIPEDYETALEGLRQTDTDMTGEILRNKTELAALAVDLEGLEGRLERTDESLEDFITERFEPLETAVSGFHGQVLAAQTEIAGLAADVERVERAQGDVGQLTEKVETLAEDLRGKADANELAGLAADVERTGARIDGGAEAADQALREAERAQNEIAGAYAEAELVDSRLRYGWNRHASRFAGKTVSIIGDSIETFDQVGYKIPGYAMFYPIPIIGVSKPEDCWWKRVIDATGAKLGVNAAYSGSRATDTLSGAPDFYARTSLLGAADLIIVALGTNDSGAGVALGEYDFDTAYTELSEATFRPAYIKGIKALKARYPTAEIICVAKIMGDGYRESIAHIAQTLGCTYIDAGDYESINGAANPHPRAYGMRQIASRVLYPTDSGLTQEHMPADALAVGQALAEIRAAIAALGGG